MTGTLTTSLNHPESGLGPLTILKWRSSVITTRIIPQIDTEFWYKILWIWTHLITIITHKKVMRNGVLAAWPFWNCKRALPQCYMVLLEEGIVLGLLKKTLLKTSKFILMYSNSLARHFSSMFHAKFLLPRLDRLLLVRSCLQNFYQCYKWHSQFLTICTDLWAELPHFILMSTASNENYIFS